MSQPADTVHQALLMCKKNSYPNIYRVLECLAVLPVTSAEGERIVLTMATAAPQNFPEGNHEGRPPGRASFDAVPQAASW